MIMVVFTSMRKTRTGSAVGNSTDVCFGCVMCLCVCVCTSARAQVCTCACVGSGHLLLGSVGAPGPDLGPGPALTLRFPQPQVHAPARWGFLKGQQEQWGGQTLGAADIWAHNPRPRRPGSPARQWQAGSGAAGGD